MRSPEKTKKKKAASRAKNVKKAKRVVKRGVNQSARVAKKSSVAKPGSKKKTSIKARDAAIKVQSGKESIKSGGKTKARTKVSRNVANINYGAPGQKRYLTPKGKQTNKY